MKILVSRDSECVDEKVQRKHSSNSERVLPGALCVCVCP